MTYDDKISQLTKKYIELYNTFKDDPTHPCHEQARGMALHDLEMKVFVYEQAIERVRHYILKHPVRRIEMKKRTLVKMHSSRDDFLMYVCEHQDEFDEDLVQLAIAFMENSVEHPVEEK